MRRAPSRFACALRSLPLVITVAVAYAIAGGARLSRAELVTDDVALKLSGQFTGQAASFSLTRDGRVLYFVDLIAGLRVFDVSDSTVLDVIDNVETPGMAQYGALSADDSTLYIADGVAGLTIFDVRNPRLVTLISSLSLPGGPAELVRSAGEHSVFVGQAPTGITVVNASSTASPHIVQNITLDHNSTTYAPFRMEVSADGSVMCALASDAAGVSYASRLFVYTKSETIDALELAYTVEIENGVDIALTRDGRHLFFTSSYESSDGSFSAGVHRFDLRDPKNPVHTATNALDASRSTEEDGAWLVYINTQETKLYVESNEFTVFRLDSNRDIDFVTHEQLQTSSGAYLYPATVIESPDGLSMLAGAGFGEDVVTVISLSPSAVLEVSTSGAAAVDLHEDTDRIGLMSIDGEFALFLQRDSRTDKGKLTVIQIRTSSRFTFVIDVPWRDGDRVDAQVTKTHLFVTNYGTSGSTSASVKYAIALSAPLSTFASRVVEKTTYPSPPPPSPSPPPPTSFSDYDVRLVDGDDAYSGRVEFYYNNVWGTVCDDGFGVEEGKVICAQLGLDFDASRNATVYGNAYYGAGTDPIYLDELKCDGTETALASCGVETTTSTWDWWTFSYTYTTTSTVISSDTSVIGVHNCGHYEDASVRCSPPKPPAVGDALGDVRFDSSLNDFQGRLEIFDGSSWVAACASAFDANAASVVCRQIGNKFSNGVMKPAWFYGASNASTSQYGALTCDGDETSVSACSTSSSCSGNDVIVSCVHDTLRAGDVYTFSEAVKQGANVFDDVSKTWYAIAGEEAHVLKSMDFSQPGAPTMSRVDVVSAGSQVQNVVLSGDRRAVIALTTKQTDKKEVITVNVTDSTAMSKYSLSKLKSLKPESLVGSPSGDIIVFVQGRTLVIVNATNGLDASIVNTYVPTCATKYEDMRINGDGSRLSLSHTSSYSSYCDYRELIDLSDLHNPSIVTAVDKVPSTYDKETISHNETSYFVFAKIASSGAHDVRRATLALPSVDMYSAPTRVGIDLERTVFINGTSITLDAMTLAGSADPLSVAGLKFEAGTGTLYGVVNKAYAGKTIELLLSYTENSEKRHCTFSIHVDSTVRAGVYDSSLVVSSPEPLLSMTIEIPASANAIFVTTDQSPVQMTASQGDRILSMFGVQAMLNDALSKLRYHSLAPETSASSHALTAKVTDLLSPELALRRIGVENFTLAHLTYNEHPRLAVAAIQDIRYTIGDRFSHSFNASLFFDSDDATLKHDLRTDNGDPLPGWLDFDDVDFKLVGSVDSALPANGRSFNGDANRYELTVPMRLSATDGYTTASSTFNLTMYNYPPRALAPQGVDATVAVDSGRIIDMTPHFEDEDLSAGGALTYAIELASGGAAPAWAKIDAIMGVVTLTPSSHHAGMVTFKVAASDGINEPAHVDLRVDVTRTELLLVFYYLTLTITALGGLSSVFAAYKYVWIVKNILRSYSNWRAEEPSIESSTDLEALISSYRIRTGSKKNELVNMKAVHSVQMLQVHATPWYYRVLSPNIQKWLSSKPLRDGRSVPTWLEIDKRELKFQFLESAFHVNIEKGMHYILLVKEKDGSTIDTLDIDLSLMTRDGGDEEMGKSPKSNMNTQ